MNDLDLREEASLVLGFRLPENPLKWEPAIKSHTMGDIDANKKWNMTIMLLMRVYALEQKLAK
jgi:hypothetical protein